MGFDYQEDMNLSKCRLSYFYDELEKSMRKVAFYDSDNPPVAKLKDGSTVKVKLNMVRKPFLVVGAPGIGKTEGVMTAIQNINNEVDNRGLPASKKWGLVKIMLGQTIMGELSGMVVPIDENGSKVVKRVQLNDLPKAEEQEYGILFLDEVTTADEAQIQPALGFTDGSRCINGGYTLPEHWIVVCAGNGPDASNFLQLPRVLLDRCKKFNIEYNYFEDFQHYVYGKNKKGEKIRSPFHPYVRGFLDFKPDYVLRDMCKEEDKADSASPCPRTWEMLSDTLIEHELDGDEVDYFALANAIVGKDAAGAFSAFVLLAPSDVQSIIQDIFTGKEMSKAEEQRYKYSNTEEFILVLQGLVSNLENLLDDTVERDASGQPVGNDGEYNFPASTYKTMANVIKYLISNPVNSLENVCAAINRIATKVNYAAGILASQDFFDMLPEWDDFFDENAETIRSDYVTFDSGN